jgi:hypothetical protein
VGARHFVPLENVVQASSFLWKSRHEPSAAGGHLIRLGFAALFLGFVMSVGMVMHYVIGAQYPTGHNFMSNVTLRWACPWTGSTAVVFGGALCMIVIGTVHTSLERYAAVTDVGAATTTARRLCLLSLVAIFLTGYMDYFVVDAIWPKFYYEPSPKGRTCGSLCNSRASCCLRSAPGSPSRIERPPSFHWFKRIPAVFRQDHPGNLARRQTAP